MNKIIEIKPQPPEKDLSRDGYWNPWLVADITLTISNSIGCSQSVEREGFHYLEWTAGANGKTDVVVEVRDGKRSLLVNSDVWRPHRENLALEGIAARYGLDYLELSDA